MHPPYAGTETVFFPYDVERPSFGLVINPSDVFPNYADSQKLDSPRNKIIAVIEA